MARRANDLYITNSRLTELLLERVEISGGVLECCAGPGVMAAVLHAGDGVDWVVTNDIDGSHGADLVGDASAAGATCWQLPGVSWVVTNPPFAQASEILPQAYKCARVGVAFLLRLSYAEPARDRAQWLQIHADQQVAQIVVNPRPHFRTGEINPDTGKLYGSDQVTVAWFVWRKDFSWRALGLDCPFQYVHGWNQ